jgi:hypothetical protein
MNLLPRIEHIAFSLFDIPLLCCRTKKGGIISSTCASDGRYMLVMKILLGLLLHCICIDIIFPTVVCCFHLHNFTNQRAERWALVICVCCKHDYPMSWFDSVEQDLERFRSSITVVLSVAYGMDT